MKFFEEMCDLNAACSDYVGFLALGYLVASVEDTKLSTNKQHTLSP